MVWHSLVGGGSMHYLAFYYLKTVYFEKILLGSLLILGATVFYLVQIIRMAESKSPENH